MSEYTWSTYSKNIFSAVVSTTDNLQINACPGSGKTTNCKEIWRRSQDDNICYVVFNKANAEEAKNKLPYKGQQSFIGTMHSLGLRAINTVLGKDKPQIDLQHKKVRKLIWDNYPFIRDRCATVKQNDIYKLVSLCKGYATDGTDICKELIDMYDISDFAELIPASQDIYQRSLHNHKIIDFDDMLLFPAVHKVYRDALPRYNMVLGDEGQDFNPVQIAMLSQIANRLLVVGDPHQAIYGFRGALNNALEQVQQTFNATVLPLNLTYRCPQMVTQEAQSIYPDDIECLPDAPSGIVRSVDPAHHFEEDYRQERDTLIVCRNMAPLVQYAYALLRKRVPVRLRGRDIGQNLVSFIKKLEANNMPDLLNKLTDWADEATAAARAKGNDLKIQTIEDKAQTIEAFVAACEGTTIQQLCDMIESIFTGDYGVELSTIHRAKGLEHKRVYILYPDLMPSKYARQPWQLTQERNLQYVAITRSKHELVYLMR